MTTNASIVLRGLGLVLHVPGLMALASLPVCYLFDEHFAIWPFVWTALISIGLGQLLFHGFRQAEETRLDHAMVIAALSWAVVSIQGSLPFLLIALRLAELPHTPATVLVFQDPLNALFEATSGFTTTGLTVALDPTALPRTLQWWRSLSQWVGGAGIIVLILSVVGSTSGVFRLYYSEGRTDRLLPSVTSTVRIIWWIYLLFTVLATLLLRLTGIPWWEALNHTMAGLSTGGFDITGNGVAGYRLEAQLAVILTMLVGAVSFSIHYQILARRRIAMLWQDAQLRALWLLLLFGMVVLPLEHLWFNQSLFWSDSLFQWSSALTTTGFSSTDLRSWSVTTHLLLTLAMFIGGSAGATASGIKLIRLVYLYKGVIWGFRRITLRPHQVMRYEVGGKALSEEEAEHMVESAGVLAMLWMVLIAVGVFVLLHVVPDQYTLSDVIFEVTSAQSNVGLSLGITSPDLHRVGRLTLIVCMYTGRLEIVPAFILASALISRLTARS